MLEVEMRRQLVKLLKPLHAFAIENGGCHPGTPDIGLARGFIECKSTERWPVRPDTPVVLDHPMTPAQRIFARKHAAAGGRCWVMLAIDGDWLLFAGTVAADVLGTATQAQLRAAAAAAWRGAPTTDDLLRVL